MALKPSYDLVGDISILPPQKEMPKHHWETLSGNNNKDNKLPRRGFQFPILPIVRPLTLQFPLLKVLSCKQYNVKEERASYKIPIFVHSSTQ